MCRTSGVWAYKCWGQIMARGIIREEALSSRPKRRDKNGFFPMQTLHMTSSAADGEPALFCSETRTSTRMGSRVRTSLQKMFCRSTLRPCLPLTSSCCLAVFRPVCARADDKDKPEANGNYNNTHRQCIKLCSVMKSTGILIITLC